MKPVPSSWNEKVNWLNYKTGVKDVFFRIHADNKVASIGIELNHADDMIRKIFFDHFVAMKGMLHETLGEEWDWIEKAFDENGKPVSLIQTKLTGVNIMDQQCWASLITFFKPRLIALDQFWGDVKDSMEGW
jgi:hypothetical protein